MENTTTPELEDAGMLFLYFMPPQWSLNAELVLMIIIFIVGVPGNALIVTVQYKNKNKTSADYLVMTMAMYEFLGSLINTTLKMIRDIVPLWHLLSSTFMCKTQPFLYFLTQYGSGITLCVLAIDRTIKTMFPLSRWYTAKHAIAISTCIFVFTLSMIVQNLIIEKWDPVTLQCALLFSHLGITKLFGIVGSMVMFTIFFIMSFSYLAIAISLKRRHTKKLKTLKYKHKPERRHSSYDDEPSSPVSVVTSCGTETSTIEYVHQKPALHEVSLQNKTPATQVGIKMKSSMLTLEGRNVNKLTVLMFLISVIYVASYLMLWYLYVTSPIEWGAGVLQLAFSIPMLNCISNPVMFFSMSTRFRNNVRVLLFSHQRR